MSSRRNHFIRMRHAKALQGLSRLAPPGEEVLKKMRIAPSERLLEIKDYLMQKTTFSPSTEMIRAAELVFTAKVMYETTKGIVVKYQQRILKEGQWPIRAQYRDLDGLGSTASVEVILRPEDAFLLEPDDFATYLARCNEERIKAGLLVSSEEGDPLLEAQWLLWDAEFHLIDLMAPVTGISADRLREASIEAIDEIVDLTLRLLAPYVRSASELLDELRQRKQQNQSGDAAVSGTPAVTTDDAAISGEGSLSHG